MRPRRSITSLRPVRVGGSQRLLSRLRSREDRARPQRFHRRFPEHEKPWSRQGDGSTCPPLITLGHAVADTGLGEDVGGAVRVVARLAPHVLDRGANRPRVTGVSRPPDPLQQHNGVNPPAPRRPAGRFARPTRRPPASN